MNYLVIFDDRNIVKVKFSFVETSISQNPFTSRQQFDAN